MEKPIILLAFANDHPEKKGYLRNLSLELNNIKRSLERAEDHHLCQLHLLPNATLDDLIHTFQRENFRDRIAIFHYGGHANSYDLMLEDQTGNLKQAKGDGLIPFLSQQKGLKLVFLNGCFSLRQAKELLEAGIPAVIGTVSAVDDQIATTLSTSFYQALAEGSTIDQAWKEATFKVQADKGIEDMHVYYHGIAKEHRNLNWQNGEVMEERFPWEIYLKEGHDNIKDWNLAQAANNPYFGLPDIPRHYYYPPEPYQFLQRYKRTDARIFFGRGNYIRDLYHRINSPHASPVILLYVQSGVGKSSFLDAGLFPRLEEEYETIYVRRNAETGIVHQLEEVRGMNDSQDFSRAWLLKESKSEKKGLIIILDQLEEVFTRPVPGKEDELSQLLERLYQIFISAQNYPKGKVILS
ncbi:MAG: CHAT domain-containing protein, partial [Bacteroidetes bacterium]|nr:CHAT domain-containing protein [Bacteroidota bacterium]